MQVGVIEGHTRIIGKSQGYLGLPLRDMFLDQDEAHPAMQSAWFPTPDELRALLAGAPLVLTVLGTAHPPVMLGVGKEPIG
jgi:hypothetical protein